MANRTPEKTPHVTSSAAIAPGCLSARWGGRRETQGETEGWVRNKGRKEIQSHGFCGNKTKTRNISKATVKPQMATPKVRQREEGDYYSLAPAHSKSAAPALAACRCCTGGVCGWGSDRWGLAAEMAEIFSSIMRRPIARDCNLSLMSPQWLAFVLIFCEYSQMRP